MPSSTRGGGGLLPSDDPSCCWIFNASKVVVVCSLIIFGFGVAFLMVGIFVNNTVRGWDLAAFDLIGYLSITLGAFMMLLSLLGVCAARGQQLIPRFNHFMLVLLLGALLLLVTVWAVLEQERIGGYITRHWDLIQYRLGLSVASGAEEDISLEEAIEMINGYFVWLLALGASGAGILLMTLIAAGHLLGLKLIALCFLGALGMLGMVEVAIAFSTFKEVPLAISVLLLMCAAIQVLCCAMGTCGFKRMNRECLCCSMTTMLISSAGLAYVVAATYLWLRDTTPRNPTNLLLVFGIALIAEFLMTSTLFFIAMLYCRHRREFKANERKELPIEYSDYVDRDRPTSRPLDHVDRGEGIGRHKGKGRSGRGARPAHFHDRL